jgi:hypothetical protein
MSLTLAAEIATALNFLIFTLVAIWYVAPWLGTQQLMKSPVEMLNSGSDPIHLV